MYVKNSSLKLWLWKWHVMAGLITLPIMILLSVTGTIYLFKDNVNQQLYRQTLEVTPPVDNKSVFSLEQQLFAVKNATHENIRAVTLPATPTQSTKFQVAGKGRVVNEIYVNPYTAEVLGEINQKDTLMYTVRKLHGELLASQVGTLIVELVASWFIVLILSGLYVWWPKKGSGIAGLLTIRINCSKRIFWRDVHAVLGFWLSVFMVIILAGAMPWTDVFGSQLKWVQKQTNTGYPMHWQNNNGLSSNVPGEGASPLSLDEINTLTAKEVIGEITIILPKTNDGVYTVSNRALWLDDQKVLHIDQYSGEVVKTLTWDDVGFLMNLRQIFMRLHQGEYGLVNWWLLLTVALLFTLTTIAGLMSYLIRKPNGAWGIPKVSDSFRVDKWLIGGIIILGIIFPMFGASLCLIWLYEMKAFMKARTKAV